MTEPTQQQLDMLDRMTIADAIRILLNHAASLPTKTETFEATGGNFIAAEPVRDARPPIERSMEALREEVSTYENLVWQLRQRLAPVLRPESSKTEAGDQAKANSSEMSDHNYQLRATIRYLGNANAGIEDILERLETPHPAIPPETSPGPVNRG